MSASGNNMIRVGMVGSAGYTGGELLRILIHHPYVDLVFAHSASNAGKKVHDVHNDLFGDTDLIFSGELIDGIDVLFLCLGHGDSKTFLENHQNQISSEVKIIDLSQDFRHRQHTLFRGERFTYGLPELNRAAIKDAQYVANPGCFATNLQLSLLPLANAGLLPNNIHVQAITGSTGAGQRPTATTHFSWRNNNISAYQMFEHRHLQEVSESLDQLQSGFLDSSTPDDYSNIKFIPQRGNFTRGIFSSTYLQTELSIEDARLLYSDYYDGHPFTHLSPVNIDLKQVVNTNKSILYLQKQKDLLLILNATDNLVKGASGQAVQNMNLLFGLPETSGLRLKSIGF